jgi:transposase InsO family protein
MCDALGVSRGGFFAWLSRLPSARATSDEMLDAAVGKRFMMGDRTYGARRVWHDVHAAGFSCGLQRIERLMALQALKARRKPSKTLLRLVDCPYLAAPKRWFELAAAPHIRRAAMAARSREQ